MLHEKFAFKRCVEAFAHRIVVAVSDRTHRGSNARFFAAHPECNRGVLRPLIRVVHYTGRFAPIDRHVERIDDELLTHVVSHRPADNASAEDIEHDSEKKKPDHIGMYVISATQS